MRRKGGQSQKLEGCCSKETTRAEGLQKRLKVDIWGDSFKNEDVVNVKNQVEGGQVESPVTVDGAVSEE